MEIYTAGDVTRPNRKGNIMEKYNSDMTDAHISVECALLAIKAVEDFIFNKNMFSSNDVVSYLESNGVDASNSAVKKLIDGLNENNSSILDSWWKNTHTLAGSVYAPVWMNVNDYSPLVFKSNVKTERDARGRLCIPSYMVRNLGLTKGDTAHVFGTRHQVRGLKPPRLAYSNGLLVKTTPHGLGRGGCPPEGLGDRGNDGLVNKYLTSLKVDKDYNIRITRSALDKAGICRNKSSMHINMSNDNKKVIIRT